MTPKTPTKVSIILPTYNGTNFLRESIESCLSQTYTNIELIIVDDASDEPTQEIIASYNDERIHLLRKNENKGLASALNTGFRNSTGDLLTWTSDDNCYAPNAITLMVNKLRRSNLDFVYCQYHRINAAGEITRLEKLKGPKHLSFGNYIGACFLYSRKVLERIGEYRSDLELVEDYEYWLRVRKHFKMALIKKPAYYYRSHQESLSSQWNTVDIKALVNTTVNPYLTKSEKTLIALKESFTLNTTQDTKKYLRLSFFKHILSPTMWRIFFLTYLNPNIIKQIRRLKRGKDRRAVTEPTSILFVISMLDTVSGPVKSLYLLASEFSKQGLNVSVAFYSGEKANAVDIFKKENITLYDLRSKSHQSFLGRLRLIFQLNTIIRQNKIDIIHTHSWDADWYGYNAALFNNVKLIITIHNLSHFTWSKKHLNKFRKKILKRANKIICVCNYLKNNLIKAVPTSEMKTEIIYNAPTDAFLAETNTEDRMRVRKQYNIDADDILLGTISNLSWVKGIGYFIEALPKLTFSNYKVLLVGGINDADKASIENYLKKNNLINKVTFTGFQENIPGILDALDLFIHPSVEEADPWVISEAMAKGKAIVATKIGGITEKISNNKIGLLVPSANSPALAVAIMKYCESSSLRAQTGKMAKEHIQTYFSFNQMIKQHKEIYLNS
ncbi:MAG: glycosyltransferase involved in cell wall biosynthesis/GT2 family glycosyltransferase [Lysobacterales bacterium]|jgi:glycosyltransferase involved in cell wall biosynthesis/GT2 family glycosyltransferase